MPWIYSMPAAASAMIYSDEKFLPQQFLQYQHHLQYQQQQQKRKGGQIRFTNEQTDALENTFDAHKYLSNNQRKKLAKSLELTERQVIKNFL